MGEYNYDSYCGLYCGACDVLVAHKTGDKSKFASFWTESTVKEFQEAQGLPYEESDLKLKCHGCKSNNVFINCRSCKIKTCAKDRAIEHCSDCSDYPCEILIAHKKGEKVLPHLKEKEGNLNTIKKAGVDQWLKEQEKRWHCPECQTIFSWYSSKCNNCGKDLRKNAFKFTWFNGFLLKIGFRHMKK
ncbi:DUF3795 domain-containing protein [Wukongibacter sp. M2B1]|uniref:DUF3795 domain-containing protein n=1 Tax=Wukongibacter sp. M2B1 TaxID=3088895 RepID=UPI003D7B6895